MAYIEDKFNVKYDHSSTCKLLFRLGFTYKKPKSVPNAADPEEQQKKVEELHNIMSYKDSSSPLLFADSVHPTHNSTVSYGWMPKGTQIELPTNTGRERANLTGALDAETKEVVIVESEAVDGSAVVDLLRKVKEKYPDAPNIFMVMDNAGSNHAKVVTEYASKVGITLVYLPPYSPNLNRIERLWKYMHKHVTNNRYYKTFVEFRIELLMFYDRLSPELGDLYDGLCSLITMNFEIVSNTGTRAKVLI